MCRITLFEGGSGNTLRVAQAEVQRRGVLCESYRAELLREKRRKGNPAGVTCYKAFGATYCSTR